MKNYFYLFIAAIVFLSACKSGSFLSQRYTHFGHVAPKTSTHVVINRQQAVTTIAPIQPNRQVTGGQEISRPIPVAAQENHDATGNAVASVSNKHVPALKIKDLGRVLNKQNKRTKALFHKKSSSEAATAHRGILSSLVGLIVSIVILAIVIAAVILIVLIVI